MDFTETVNEKFFTMTGEWKNELGFSGGDGTVQAAIYHLKHCTGASTPFSHSRDFTCLIRTVTDEYDYVILWKSDRMT